MNTETEQLTTDVIPWPIPVYQVRPPKSYANVIRYAEGQWIEDDGEWDLAFVGKEDGAPMAFGFQPPFRENILWAGCTDKNWGAHIKNHPSGNAWHYMLRPKKKTWGNGDWGSRNHINSRVFDSAMNKCSAMNGCANGRGPELRWHDTYLLEGLLREKETKRVVVLPAEFVCMYCGPLTHDLKPTT